MTASDWQNSTDALAMLEVDDLVTELNGDVAAGFDLPVERELEVVLVEDPVPAVAVRPAERPSAGRSVMNVFCMPTTSVISSPPRLR